MRYLTLFIVSILLSSAVEPWGNSPGRNMVREAKNLPDKLDKSTLVWEVETGAGHQYPMPTIVGDRCLIGGDGKGNPEPWYRKGATLSCRSLEDGREIWRLMVPEGGYGPATYGVCGTPVVKGDRVYVMAMHDVFCLDLDGLADGNDGMQEELSIYTRRPFKPAEGATMPTELPQWSADVIWHYSLKEFKIQVQDATSCSVLEVDGRLWVSTANEVGSLAAKGDTDDPHMVVLDCETGKLIARDKMDVPIVFHGEWSSPSLIEVNGEKAVLFGDGYGVLHAFAVPEAKGQGAPVILKEYWTLDLNPRENRFMEDGREIVYTLDKRISYKYPKDYYSNAEKYYMYSDDIPDKGKNHSGFARGAKQLADGRHETVKGPCEIISMPVVVGNRIYIGIGRDGAYGLGNATGRFMCIEVKDVKQKPSILWEDREIGRTQATASVVEGLVYIADGHGKMNCYDAGTGEVVYRWEVDSKGIKERSQLVADGKIYIGTDKREMKVLKAGREPVLLSSTKLPDHAATVEVADGLVLVATHRNLLLYGNKKAVAAE